MKNYIDLLKCVLENGEPRDDRTGHGTRSLFGETLKFDLSNGFPAVTTKKLHFGGTVAELCAFLRGYDTLEQFHSVGCNFWDGNGEAPWWTAKVKERHQPAGYLGRIYGVHWRRWLSCGCGKARQVDQLREAVDLLRKDPWTRRAIISAWDPDTKADEVCLPSCHHIFQFSLRRRPEKPGRMPLWWLDCAANMRSVDLMLGLPHDVASYALLTHIVAQEIDAKPGVLTFFLGDAHIYNNHIDACQQQLTREPFPLPQLQLDPLATIDNFDPGMAQLDGYRYHSPIKAQLNV